MNSSDSSMNELDEDKDAKEVNLQYSAYFKIFIDVQSGEV